MDDRYHIWRVPLVGKASKERVGEVVIDAYTSLIVADKSTSPNMLEARLLGRTVISQPKNKKMKLAYEFEEPIMYTTGAFIQPMKLTKENGREVWFWVVSEFDGDAFYDGDVHNPKECGDTIEELLSTEPEIDAQP